MSNQMDKKQEYAIEVSHISKSYRMFENPSDRLKQTFTKKKLYEDFWALHDISFKVPKGSVVGIVGRNGSGKSTLLQILAGTLAPTSGEYKINGKIAALLELGSGFNPEFTGRENVYLSGSIYGISESEMDKRIEKIEKFADIGAFIDQPVKSYSSGMFARLAFAVNINVDADILIVDEVLSVGDHFFQAKCMQEINKLMSNGTTILLVSHSQAMVKALCSSAILFNKGHLVLQGECDEVMDRYMAISLSEEKAYKESMARALQAKLQEEECAELDAFEKTQKNTSGRYVSVMQPPLEKRITERFGSGCAQFVEAAIFQGGTEAAVLQNRENATISVWIKANEEITTPSEVGVVVRTFEGIDLFALNPFFISKSIQPMKKGNMIRVDFTFNMLLGPGKYSVTLGMRTPVQGEYADKMFNAIVFDVIDSSSKTIPLLFDVPFEMNVTVEEN